MIVVDKLRELTVSVTPAVAAINGHNASLGHLSAASGMVVMGTQLYVVADDELHLGLFSLGDKQPGQCLTLFAGELPVEKKQRKKLKPDLETLTLLPAIAGFPQGALLALGSGSKDNRQRAIIIALDKNADVENKPVTVDLSALYKELRLHFADLNIEGAVISNNHLILMQRGNQTQPQCALIYCPLEVFLPLLHNPLVDFSGRLTIQTYTLPTISGVPLCFTDGVVLPNGDILFSAVAESTDDSYNDGECVGAALGIITTDGQLACCELLQEPYKIEGVAIRQYEGQLQVLLVTDADNAAIPAALLAVTDTKTLFTV